MAFRPPQLISYIAPGAPATRRPAEGNEAFLRPEVGFTPKWYRERLGIDFGEVWHTDPSYRREAILSMRGELRRCFPGTRIGGIDRPDSPLDLLTGTFGATTVAAIYGVPIYYSADNWPNCEHRYLSDREVDRIEPPDLNSNPFFQGLLAQVDWIAEREGTVLGYINWQGILNNAHRLRGEDLFFDMMTNPARCQRLFKAVCTTQIEGCRILQERQRASGFQVDFATVSNCLVNMVSPKIYRDLLFPYDLRISDRFSCLGIHNCAWNADPYLEDYANVLRLAYIDMGQESDLFRARQRIPHARRALMYTPMDLVNKPFSEVRADLERIARDYGPCDVVLADIEAGTPDGLILDVLQVCADIGDSRAIN